MRKAKYLIRVACVILGIMALISCSSQSGEELFDLAFDTSAEEAVSLHGKSLKISGASAEELFFYEPETTLYDLVLSRFKEIEDKYDTHVELVSGDVIAQFYEGIQSTDIIAGYINGAATAGALMPFTELDIDLTDFDKYGYPYMLEYAMAEGVPYGAYPGYWPLALSNSNCGNFVLLNEVVIKKYGFVDPRERFDNGEWTLDGFKACLPDYYISAGKDTIYALAWNGGNIFRHVKTGSGMDLADVVNGIVVSGYSLPQAVETMNWYLSFIDDCKHMLNPNGGYGQYDIVAKNDCAMYLLGTDFLDGIVQNIEDFGLLPFPSSKYIKYGSNYGTYEYTYEFGILGNVENPDGVCEAFKTLLDPFEGYATMEEYIKFLTNNIFFDRRDAIQYITHAKYARFIHAGDPVGWDGKSSPSQFVEAYATKANEGVQYLAKNYLLVDEMLKSIKDD